MVEAEVLRFAFEPQALLARGRALAPAYRSADPFPHVVLEDLVPELVAEAVLDELGAVAPEHWVRYSDGGNTEKLAVSDEDHLGPATRHLIAQLHSRAMIGFLEELTGITGLVADPWLLGGGLHELPIGGFLNVHADFNRHPHLGLTRRLNLLLYLNPGWDERWGGELELWAPGAAAPARVVLPTMGRVVVFSTTDRSLHGNPTPVACPPGRARRSLALYYYSAPLPEEDGLAPHSTLYGHAAAPPAAPRRGRHLATRVLPPIVVDALRRARRSAS